MATLDERLKDDDYRHWVKAVLCLQYTKDGLVSLADRTSQILHNAVLAQMRGSGNPSANGICTPARIDLKKKTVICCSNCNAFLAETKKHCTGTLNLNNSDVTNLHDQPWQLAKLFMNPGQDVTNTVPGQTDLSGILNFLDHCRQANILNTPNIKAVKDTRNRILHTADMKIPKHDFSTNIIPTLTALLKDPWFLSTDPAAQDAVVKITEVAAAAFHITKENEEKVLKELATEFRRLSKDLNTRIDDLRMEVNRVETNGGQEMKAHQDKLDKLETELQDRDKDVQKLEKLLQTLKQKVEDDTGLVTTLGKDVSAINTLLRETRQDYNKLTAEIRHIGETCERKHTQVEEACERTEATCKLKHEEMAAEVRHTGETCKGKHEEMGAEIRHSGETCKLKHEEMTAEIRHTGETCERKHGEMAAEIRYTGETCKRKHEETAADIDDLRKEFKKTKQQSITDEDEAKLRACLEHGYTGIKLEVPFLLSCHEIPVSEIFAPVILKKDTESPASNQGTGKSEKQLRSYKEIFFIEDVLQKNIILLGKAGAGKTTFCKHLTDIWCSGKVSPQFMDAAEFQKFRYLFSVSCRFAEPSESIFTMICNQLFRINDEMIEVARQVLKNTPEECLVVLDGIDEWKGSASKSTGRRGDILGHPSREGLEDCVVLSTSRPERIHMLPTKLDKHFSVLELQGIDRYEKLIRCILEKAEYPDPEKSCSEFLSQIRDSKMTDLLQFPLMLINALNIWDMNKTLSSSMCINYSKMVEGFFSRAKSANRIEEHEQERRNETCLELPDCFRHTDMSKQNARLIIKLGKLAYDLLFNDEQDSSLIFSGENIQGYLTKDELSTSLATGILSKAQMTSRSIRKIESYSFCHKTFQEFLGALWLSMEQSNLMIKFTKQFKSIYDLFANRVFILFMCGLSPGAGERFWRCIADEVIAKDKDIANYRLGHFSQDDCFNYNLYFSVIDNNYCPLVDETQDLVLECIKEARCSSSEHNQQLFYVLPDIFINSSTSKQSIRLCYGLMKKFLNEIKSIKLQGLNDFRILKPKLLTMGVTEKSQLKKESPLQLTNLFVHTTKLPHSVIEQFGSSLRDFPTLKNLVLDRLYCSDHREGCYLPLLDLQRHYSLETVKVILENLSVESVLLPGRGTLLSQLTKLTVECIKISHSGIEQLCSCLRDSSTLQDLVLAGLSCSGHGTSCCFPVLDLQSHHCLEKVRLAYLSVESVLLPGRGDRHPQLKELIVYDITISHSGMKQLCSCLPDLSTLQYLKLISLHCSGHGTSCCLPVLDLQSHHWLEKVKLRDLSVESVLLPGPAALFSGLTQLIVDDINISHSGMKQLFSCLRDSSTLWYLDLASLYCSDHGNSSCRPVLDLQSHQWLHEVTLMDLSVESVRLPGRQEGEQAAATRLGIIPPLKIDMVGVSMPSEGWRSFIDSIEHMPYILNACLNSNNIDEALKSYIRSCSHLTVAWDDSFQFRFFFF